MPTSSKAWRLGRSTFGLFLLVAGVVGGCRRTGRAHDGGIPDAGVANGAVVVNDGSIANDDDVANHPAMAAGIPTGTGTATTAGSCPKPPLPKPCASDKECGDGGECATVSVMCSNCICRGGAWICPPIACAAPACRPRQRW